MWLNSINGRKSYNTLDFSSWPSNTMFWNILVCLTYSNTNNKHILCIRKTFDFIMAICWRQIKTTTATAAKGKIANNSDSSTNNLLQHQQQQLCICSICKHEQAVLCLNQKCACCIIMNGDKVIGHSVNPLQ